jgi:hypothetical protein
MSIVTNLISRRSPKISYPDIINLKMKEEENENENFRLIRRFSFWNEGGISEQTTQYL